jgi:general secretion pathway protein A
MFQDSLHSGLFKPLYICHTTTGVNEFYSHLCHALGLESRFRKAAMFRAVQEKIISMNKTGRIHPVLVIDETQLLANDILAELRLLTNFEIDSVNALTVLMCGQENLRQRFGLSVLESLANSITVSVNVESLPKEETFLYIERMVTLAGMKKPLFTKAAMEFIHQASGGILRAINAVANAALSNAFLKKAEIVEVEHARAMMER